LRGRVRKTMAVASPRWHSISCGVMVPQRRRLSGLVPRSLARSDPRTAGSLTVFIRLFQLEGTGSSNRVASAFFMRGYRAGDEGSHGRSE
jgi:hypothetical protein